MMKHHMWRKRPSRRRLKAQYLIGRFIALEDIYEHRLVAFIKQHGYTTSQAAFVRRRT